MEKPAPTPFQLERYGSSEKRESVLHDRYAERMIARGIPVMTDAPDETDKPAWRGDHAFSSDAASYSLMHFVEPEVAAEHPDWGLEKVKTEARERFTRRLEQDLSYEHKESSHEETIVHWKPIVTSDGQMELATEYGGSVITLRELWEHTKEYAAFVGNPAAYNPLEEQAQMRMQDEFIRGSSTGFLTVLSHPDAVRYVQVWEKTSDGDIVSKQVDLFAATGTDFTREEGDRLVRHVARYYNATASDSASDSSQYAHAFIEYGTMHDQHIRIIAQGMAMHRVQVISEIKETSSARMYSIEKKIVTNTRDSLVVLGTYLHRQIDEKLRVLQSADQVSSSQKVMSRRLEKGKDQSHVINSEVRERPVGEPEDPRMVFDRVFHEGEVSEIFTTMQHMMAEWYISRNILIHAKDVPAGAHAVLFWFSTLELQRIQPKNSSEYHMAERLPVHTIIDTGASRIRKIFFGLRDIVRTKIGFLRSIREINQPASAVHTDKESVQRMSPMRRLTLFIDRIVSKTVGRKDRSLGAHVLSEVVSKKRIDVGVPGSAIEQKLVADPKEQQAVIIHRVETGVVIWYLLVGDVYNKRGFVQLVDMSRGFLRKFSVLMDLPQREDHLVQTPPIWVLLSIVRYLSLLRESGQGGPKTNATYTRAKRKRRLRLYDSITGSLLHQKISRPIIFTFAS